MDNSEGFRSLGVSLYIPEGMCELKSIVVLSNAQPYERGHPIYPKYVENPTYIPETNLEVRGEPADILVVRGRTTQSPECSAGLPK